MEPNKTILLVEDEAIIAMAHATALQRRGYKVVCCRSGEEAVQSIKEQPEIDLVLMDINLGPGMDGTKAAEQILQLRSIPLIFLSAHSEPEVVKKTEGIGSYGFIVKNSGIEVLVACMNMAFKLFESKTRERESRDALQDSEKRFFLAMEATKDGIWDWDVETDSVFYSIGWKTMLGYAENEIGTTLEEWLSRIHPEDRSVTLMQVQRHLRGETDYYSAEHRLQCKDGSYKWILDRGKVIEWTDGGRPRRVVGTHTDINKLRNAENAIQQAKLDWAHTIDAVPDMIAVVDCNHDILLINYAMAKYLGMPQQVVEGRKCYELMHGTAAPPDYCNHMKMMSDGSMHYEKFDETLCNGIFDVTVSPIHDKAGNVTAFVHVMRDVSERKRLEVYRNMGQRILLALQGKLSLKLALLEIITIVKSTTETDAVGIRLQEGDDYPYFFQEGFSTDFLSRENSLKARTVDGGVCRDEHGNICLECTCGLVIAGKTDPANPLFTKGGSFWTNDSSQVLHVPSQEDPRTSPRNECIHQGFASVALVPIRAKGSIVGLLQLNDRRKGRFTLAEIEILEGIAENIGEAMLRKQAEEALVASEERFRLLFERHCDVMLVIDPADGSIIDANNAAAEFYGYSRDEMLKMHIDQIKCLPDRAMADVMESATNKKECSYIFQHCLCDGTVRNVEVHSSPIPFNDKIVIFSIIRDITERQRMAAEHNRLEAQLRQAQKMEAIGLLAGGIAHDFNNLLTAIIGCGQMIFNRIPSDSPIYLFAQMVIEAGEKAAGLTHSLLAFSRRQTLNPTPLNLCEIVAGLEKMLARILREDIDFRTLVHEKELVVMADKGQIEQVVMNFVTNANDAMPYGGTLTIDVSPFDMDAKFILDRGFGKPGHYARITVTDSGCGMDEELQQKIFEPFYTTKELGKGTGLGLSIVYGIVKQHDGYIDLSSEPGSGTSFRVYLPLMSSGSIEAHGILSEQPPQGGSETILLVEDDENVRKLYRIVLEDAGYTVITANDGEDAVAQFAGNREEIDLLLSDVVMPKLDGYSLYKEIKRMRPGVKALFTSGYTKDIMNNKGIPEENLNYLAKPVKPHELLAGIRTVLDSPAWQPD